MRRPRRSLDALLVIVALVLVSGVGLAAPWIRAEPAGSAVPSAPAGAAPTPTVTPAASTAPLVGTTYVLAPDGHDDDPGTAAKPWATLAHAEKRLKPGDTLEVKGGTYKRESIDWQTSGSAVAPITVRAAAGAHPVFDGGGVGHFAVIRGGAGYLVFDGLTITGYDIVDDGIIVAMDGAHHLTFENLRMTGNGGQDQRSHLIYLGSPDVHDVVIRANLLDGIAGGAIHLYHAPNAQHVQITDNVMRGSHWGVIVTSGASDVVIDHNTFINDDVGVEMWDATGVQVTNNLITSDHGVGIRLQSLAPLTEDYDLLQIHGDPFVIDTDELDLAGWRAATKQGAHSVVATPGVALIGSDLRVLPGSPAAGAASDGSDLGTRVFP
jgi:Periplasmic copper-binding protein (NosD)